MASVCYDKFKLWLNHTNLNTFYYHNIHRIDNKSHFKATMSPDLLPIFSSKQAKTVLACSSRTHRRATQSYIFISFDCRNRAICGKCMNFNFNASKMEPFHNIVPSSRAAIFGFITLLYTFRHFSDIVPSANLVFVCTCTLPNRKENLHHHHYAVFVRFLL